MIAFRVLHLVLSLGIVIAAVVVGTTLVVQTVIDLLA